MFQLTKSEFVSLKSQSVISSRKGAQRPPYAFTEQGVAMLSSILRSERAIEVNIEIIRTFVRLRRLLASNEDIRKKLEALEKKFDGQFQIVFQAIQSMIEPPLGVPRKIGFQLPE